MNDFYYRKLDAYKIAKTLVIQVYSLLRSFPEEERFALNSQIRRAAISIPSNIAEGMGRFSIKERIHFLDIAYGSLSELTCQLEIAHDLKYISPIDFQQLEELSSRVSMTLYGLKKSLKNKQTLTPE